MAIVQGTRRINPLDLNKNVTIGMAFPLDETNMFQGTESVKDQIKANLLNVLLLTVFLTGSLNARSIPFSPNDICPSAYETKRS